MIHLLQGGVTPCLMQGLPGDWPPGHQWASVVDYKQITCQTCIERSDEVRARLYLDAAEKKLGREATEKELMHEVMQNLSKGSINPRVVRAVIRERKGR